MSEPLQTSSLLVVEDDEDDFLITSARQQSYLSPVEVSADGFDLRANIECGLAVASGPTADWRELVDEASAEAELIVTRSHSLAE